MIAPNPTGYCECGCGESTRVVNGKPNRYIKYHHHRVLKGNSWRGCAKLEPGFRVDRTYGIAIIPIADSELETYVDAEAANEVGNLRLRLSHHGYAVFSTKQGERFLHRKLTGAVGKQQVDHINGNILDNRSCNLRIADAAENKQNAKINSGNTSGFKGVGRYDGAWRAYITKAGRQRFLGRFETIEDAARAYDSAAREEFGEFARVNFPHQNERGCRA